MIVQFAQFVGAAFTGGATIAVWVNMSGDGGTIAARVIMACLAGAAGLEGFLDFCLGCFAYKIFQKLGIFSADPSKKCDEIAEDTRSTLGVRPRACLVCLPALLAYAVLPAVLPPSLERGCQSVRDCFALVGYCSYADVCAGV